MSKIKRAIIMAAGTGTRMHPVTLQTPKPLVKINGKRMIDSVIDGLLNNDITEIYVVVGYLKEQFLTLNKKYPNVVLIDNPYFDKCNNIASLYVARNYLEDVIILDGDQIIYDESILANSFEKSGYSAIWTDNSTKEWVMTVENNKVIHCSRNGADRGWQLFSISRWKKEDGIKLKSLLEYEFEVKKNRQIYWDDVPMILHLNEFDLGIYPMNKDSIIEVDNLSELIELDNSYNIYEN